MFHLVARSLHGDPLFRTWEEARRLWDDVVRATPDRAALVLMPNHLHVVHPLDVHHRLSSALAGYARWWNHRRGTSGRVFDVVPPGRFLESREKVRLNIRYVHLNPCRGSGLVKDPLAWPFSTHRDACGLALPPVVQREHDVVAFHRYVSADPRVDVRGTPLPGVSLEAASPLAVLHAVSAVTRTPLSRFRVRNSVARQLYLRAAVQLCPKADRRAIGELVGIDRNGAARAARGTDPGVAVVARAVGDARFTCLHDRRLPWRESSPPTPP